MKKVDLRDYLSDELANWIFNDEQLYEQCCSVMKYDDLKTVLESSFIFTELQWAELVSRLEIINETGDFEQFRTWPNKGGEDE